MATYDYMGKYKIFDSEVHLASSKIPEYGQEEHLRTLFSFRTPEDVVAGLDEFGIQKAIVGTPCLVSGGAKEFLDHNFRMSNKIIADAQAKYPDRIVGAGRVNPNYGDEALEEFERCIKDYKLRALKLHPMCEFFYPSHRYLPPIFEMAREHNVVIMFHTGDGPLIHSTGFLDLAQNFPEVTILLYHLGGANGAKVAKQRPNMYLTTSGRNAQIDKLRAIKEIGADRVLYGSDMPFANPIPDILKITLIPESRVSDEEKAMVLGGNLARLLNVEL
jgi:predicted TIM-barrel fold metal-dependent hydrolase